ncbi:MAG TPA: 2Fe-2S iron-sulfur cluster-binding protein [Syntrophomonas sp.]|nr:2Fe-2S iron-sulfur cluster-binding protein [Syntrophomonas sp.]
MDTSEKKTNVPRKIKIIVNGKEVEVDDGLTILLALLKEQIYCPHLCYDVKRLLRTGNCCKCLVELNDEEGVHDVRACETPVKEGMVICTDSPRLEAWRKGAKTVGKTI